MQSSKHLNGALLFEDMSIQFQLNYFLSIQYLLPASHNIFSLLARTANFCAFPLQFWWRKGVGHLYSQSKGRGFQKISWRLRPKPLFFRFAPIHTFLSRSSRYHAHPVGKIAVYTPSILSRRPLETIFAYCLNQSNLRMELLGE